MHISTAPDVLLAPMGGFAPAMFEGRRRRILDALGNDAMVLPAAPVVRASQDTEYPYRPDSELFYATGVVEPEAVAVLRGHADEDRFVLFVRPRDPDAELWSGPRMGPERARERFGADATWPATDLEERLPGLLGGADHVHYRLGASSRVEALVRQALARARSRGSRKGTGPRGVLDPGGVLDPLRLVKEEAELERLRQAVSITVRAHREAMRAAGPGVGEWEIQASLEASFRRSGAEGPAYGTIVASGRNACVLHYVENRKRMDAGDLVLLDAGASLGLYAADITRTFPASGRFGPEQRAVYDVVEEARRRAVEVVRPGAAIADVHGAALQALAEGLMELGVLEGPAEAVLEDEAHKPFFPHQTSHWLGLDVHDPGDYAFRGQSTALEPGMVFTVEPGLYFRPGGPGDEGPFSGIGIRIEDDVVVTEDGCEVMSSDLPTEAEKVEALVESAREDGD